MSKLNIIFISFFLAFLMLGFDSAFAQQAPLVPANVRAGSSERGGVLVQWTRPTLGLVLDYDVYRSTRPDSRGTRIARKVSGEEYLDTKATVGSTSYYSVRSVDVNGNTSLNSTNVQVTVRDLVPPAPPSNVRITSADEGEVRISWSKPSGEQVISYIVYRSQSPGLLGDRRIQTSKTSYSEFALPDGRTYHYTIVAIDNGGNRSDESASAQVTTTNTRNAPLDVSGVRAVGTGRSGEIRVSWIKPSSVNFSSVWLYRSTVVDNRGKLAAGNVKGSFYTDRNLVDGITYYYTVETRSKGGVAYESRNNLSASPFVASKSAAAPPKVTNAKAQDLGDGRRILLAWTNPESATYQSLRIYRSEDAVSRGELIATNLRADTYTDSGVSGDTRYFYTIATVGTNGIESQGGPIVGGIATLRLSGEGAGVDSDGDGLPDSWERSHGYHPRVANDPAQDDDGDGLSLLDEYLYGANPWDPDSDSDGYSDGTEVANGYSPVGPGRLASRQSVQQISRGNFAYNSTRLSSLEQEASLATELKRLLEQEFGTNRIPNPRAHWPKLVNAYIYGGYTVSEIAHTLRFGPGLVHPNIPASEWRQSRDYQRARNF